MTAWAWLLVLAATSALVVAALATSRKSSDPLWLPLALLALDQFTWNAASIGIELTHDERYIWVAAISAPFFVPLALHFVLHFVGRARAQRTLLIAVYAVFTLRGAFTLLDFVVPGFDVPGGLATHAVVLLLTGVPFGAVAFALVLRHLRDSPNEAEQRRSRVLLFALVLITLLLPTDPLSDLGVQVPRLATFGSLAFNVALTFVALGTSVVSGSRRVALGLALVVGLLVAIAFLTLFITFQSRLGVLIVAMTSLSLGLVAALRVGVISFSASRAALERYASFGRFTAQMAHDLKNPLAAARGAAEFLAEELRRSGQPPTQQEFATLIVQQLDRLRAIIDRYQQLAKLELVVAPVDLNALVRRVLALQSFATASQVTVKLDLDAKAPQLRADEQLLGSALENLVKNALEAMSAGGTLTVTTAAGDVVGLSVRDTGQGMDARTLEQAFTPFFTTKASGSGMGLAFVRQVARAHGGDAVVHSKPGAGTVVELKLPAEPPEAA